MVDNNLFMNVEIKYIACCERVAVTRLKYLLKIFNFTLNLLDFSPHNIFGADKIYYMR